MEIVVRSLAEDAPCAAGLWDLTAGGWPTFMLNDPTADLYYEDVESTYPEHVLLAYSPYAPEIPLARAFSVPFHWDRPVEELPAGGWDWVVRQSCADRLHGRSVTMVSALEITIRPDHRGTGLSTLLLNKMRENVARLGFPDLVAPVRPNGKHRVPLMPMADYLRRVRPDGLPDDPWLRVHIRAGGRIIRIAPLSMVIPGTLAQWREWTGLAFDLAGQVIVPEALGPVECFPNEDRAVYVESNVWVHHRLTPA
jgi:GNAT superfamily N-acetyltransferase